MAILTYYHDAEYGTCDGKTYARQGFDVPGYWTIDGRQPRPQVSEGIGVEIECGTNVDYNWETGTNYDNPSDFVNNYLEPKIRKVFDEGFFKYQSDGSIEYEYPVEIISQVFTRAWYKNEGREKLKLLFDKIFYELHISQNRSCGNHINISKALFYNDRAAWLFDEEITDNYYTYCVQFGRADYEGEYNDTTYYARRESAVRESGHETAINWAHWNEGAAARLEARIIGMATSGEEYCSYIDAIFNLIDECNAKAKAENQSLKREFIANETIYYDQDGNATGREVEYRPGYTGEWFRENESCKKTTKQNIRKQTIIYNEYGVRVSKRTDYYKTPNGIMTKTINYFE